MIEITRGNILEADAEALVNTVNCMGYMGKGIALQFKKAFPENFKAYHQACKASVVKPGSMYVFHTGNLFNPKYVINFPTKYHWRGKSRLEDINSGLSALIEEVRRLDLKSIAVPPLGCGLGGLDWEVVRPLIEKTFEAVPRVKVLLYEPAGAPEAKTMPVGTARPRLTISRALLIKLMQQYSELNYRLTLLEIHKLAYFLQETGQPLKLQLSPGVYGPYAPNLNKVLECLEGHFIRGYGDTQKPDVEIGLMAGAAEEADMFLRNEQEAKLRLEKVNQVIDGFETPYGMELLSSVHWVAVHKNPPVKEPEIAIERIQNWNDRKRKMFKPDHIKIAWKRLQEEGWL
ncbi:MAG: macro domain-containing protein [Candidatus Glassbacteria bacterium]|nr:macro domain-containing protein [Candidatus Glassbacteria bacterium]